MSSNIATYASGLTYPRGLKFGPDGALYVAEAGSGGDTESMGSCEGFTSMFVPYHIGMTARVSRIGPDGARSTVVENLPSAQDRFGDVLGASDIVFVDDTLYAISSGGGCSHGFAGSPAGVVKVNSDGTTDLLADLSAFFTAHPAAAGNEEDYEPDGAANAIVAHDGKLYVVNANHGALDEITLDGQVRRVLDITASEGHVTPASLTVYDGNFYVGALGEFPIKAGSSKVYRVNSQSDLSVAAEGLTAILGLAFDEQGQLYVLEATAVDSDYPSPGSGRVVRVGDDGDLEVIATGLSFPIGMTFGPDGALYISNHGYGGDPTAGEVVRIQVDASLATSSTPTPTQAPEQGTLEKGTVTSPALAGNLLGDTDTRRYFIYLPPSYHVSDRRYPVVYFLHDDPDMAELEQTGVRQAMDAMIRAGEIGELIAVFPNAVPGTGLSWYRNSPVTGNYETYITQDLVDAIDATYRTIANPASRAIASVGGIGKLATAGSGANGALHLALSHPDVFGATAAVNGIFDVEAWVDAKLRSYRLAPQNEDKARITHSIAAVVSPNPDTPPEYMNPLFEQIDGEWDVPANVREKIRLLNPLSDLDAYANQPNKLRGILIVQQAKWAEEAQPLDETMTALGLDHEYLEYDGPFIAATLQKMVLDSLARTLVFGQE